MGGIAWLVFLGSREVDPFGLDFGGFLGTMVRHVSKKLAGIFLEDVENLEDDDI